MATTTLTNLIDPEVFRPMITAYVNEMVRITPFMFQDNTLVGSPGSTVSIAQYEYIGDADDLGENTEGTYTALSTTQIDIPVKKAFKGVEYTDEAKLYSLEDPVNEVAKQLARAIANKIDADGMTALLTATQVNTDAANVINYENIVATTDYLENEEEYELVMFIHPDQMSDLRLDTKFIDKTLYGGEVMMTGEVGRIAGCRIVKSFKVTNDGTSYFNPIVQIGQEVDYLAALTKANKRALTFEMDRDITYKKDLVNADEHYGIGLSNPSRVAILECLMVPVP